MSIVDEAGTEESEDKVGGEGFFSVDGHYRAFLLRGSRICFQRLDAERLGAEQRKVFVPPFIAQ